MSAKANWAKVYHSENEYRANIVKDILDKSGYRPVILKKKDSSYNNFGEYEVVVESDYVIRALKVISDEITFE